MFTDITERPRENFKRRNDNIENLNKILLHGEKPETLRGILFFEERGNYVCAFLQAAEEDRTYDREEILGDIHRERDRVTLFARERDCVEQREECVMDDPIPGVLLDPGFFVECVVVDISKFSETEIVSVPGNLSVARDLLITR